MSKQPQDNANSVNVALKRKRAPVWTSATKAQCEEVLSSLTSEGLLQELNPSDQSSVNKGITKGKVQHERYVLSLNDQGLWTRAKIRQHAQDPARAAGATGFEGGHVSIFNSSFSKLLRSIVRGCGRGQGDKRDPVLPITEPSCSAA
jgi:hypothetical protein